MREVVLQALLLYLLALSAMVALTSCNAKLLDGSPPSSSSPNSPTKTTPVITWAQPAPITNPVPLTIAQLDATANVPGTFLYTPAAGTVLPVGTQTLTAAFTPADPADYNTATISVTLVVNATTTASTPYCGQGSPAGSPSVRPDSGNYLAVADGANNRVMIYAAPYSNDQAAVVVLGQPDFAHGTANEGCGPAANTLSGPWGLAMDSSGNLYVSDSGNCRVLQFRPPFTTGMSASIVLGESQFTGGPCQPSPSAGPANMVSPFGLAFDPQGDLWVADYGAARVAEYVPPFANGMTATVAIGQINLGNTYNCNGMYLPPGTGVSGIGGMPPPADTEFCDPRAVAFDSSGNLWVADGNARAMEFVPPFSTGMASSVELQTSGTITTGSSCSPRSSITGVANPWSLAFDARDTLWIGAGTVCYGFGGGEGLLEFSPPFANGSTGTVVISPMAYLNAPAASNVSFPSGLSFDDGDNLIVADGGNHRVLIFAPPLGPGMNATTVLGQPSMNSGIAGIPCNPSANTLCFPSGVLAF